MFKTGALATGEKWRDNWITPPEIISLIDQTFGQDNWIDPCPINPDFDALCIDWPSESNFYINPPFSEYSDWVYYFERDFNRSNFIWLCNSNTETKWYQTLLKHSQTICFPNKRIKFIDPRTGLSDGSPRQGNTLFLIGPSIRFSGAFYYNFGPLGHIVQKR